MNRRDLLAMSMVFGLLGCQERTGERRPHSATVVDRWVEFGFEPTAHYGQAELVTLMQDQKLLSDAPLLIALHGRGEAGRGLEAGARGWRDDYELGLADQRLRKPPLKRGDFHGFVESARLERMNALLKREPFRGILVACPYSPALRDRSPAGARPFGEFVTRDLIAAVDARRPKKNASSQVGIDGVSMGGRLALWLGLLFPQIFTTVGAMQPAIGVDEADQIAELVAKARSQAPKQQLRLMSSDKDPFLPAVIGLSKALKKRSLKHSLLVTPGPHDYIYNRGPGSYEMLLWHERVLRGLPAV